MIIQRPNCLRKSAKRTSLESRNGTILSREQKVGTVSGNSRLNHRRQTILSRNQLNRTLGATRKPEGEFMHLKSYLSSFECKKTLLLRPMRSTLVTSSAKELFIQKNRKKDNNLKSIFKGGGFSTAGPLEAVQLRGNIPTILANIHRSPLQSIKAYPRLFDEYICGFKLK